MDLDKDKYNYSLRQDPNNTIILLFMSKIFYIQMCILVYIDLHIIQCSLSCHSLLSIHCILLFNIIISIFCFAICRKFIKYNGHSLFLIWLMNHLPIDIKKLIISTSTLLEIGIPNRTSHMVSRKLISRLCNIHSVPIINWIRVNNPW